MKLLQTGLRAACGCFALWPVAEAHTEGGGKLLSDTGDLDGNHELVFETNDRNGTNIFWKLVVFAPE